MEEEQLHILKDYVVVLGTNQSGFPIAVCFDKKGDMPSFTLDFSKMDGEIAQTKRSWSERSFSTPAIYGNTMVTIIKCKRENKIRHKAVIVDLDAGSLQDFCDSEFDERSSVHVVQDKLLFAYTENNRSSSFRDDFGNFTLEESESCNKPFYIEAYDIHTAEQEYKITIPNLPEVNRQGIAKMVVSDNKIYLVIPNNSRKSYDVITIDLDEQEVSPAASVLP